MLVGYLLFMILPFVSLTAAASRRAGPPWPWSAAAAPSCRAQSQSAADQDSAGIAVAVAAAVVVVEDAVGRRADAVGVVGAAAAPVRADLAGRSSTSAAWEASQGETWK